MVFLFLFVLFGCEKNVGSQPAILGTDLEINMQLASDQQSVVLGVSTVKLYSCFNCTLDTLLHRSENYTRVVFTGVSRPQVCLTAFGTAKTNIALDPGNDPMYVELVNDGITNVIEISEDEEKFILTPTQVKNITISNFVLFKKEKE